MATKTFSVEIYGKFGNYYYNIPSSEISSSKNYFACIIENNISNHSTQSNLVLNTCNNPTSNLNVLLVDFNGGKIDFIPNIIFKTFEKLEHLVVSEDRGLMNLEPEYFENALNLKILSIPRNSLDVLEAGIFINAPNLEVIDLRSNFIIIIHELTFMGLPQLQRLYLSGNNLYNLNFYTFSILHLNELDLQNNPCFNILFSNMNGSLNEIREELNKDCVEVTTSAQIDHQSINYSDHYRSLDVRFDSEESHESKFKKLSEMIDKTNLKLTKVQDELKEMANKNQQMFKEILEKLNTFSNIN